MASLSAYQMSEGLLVSSCDILVWHRFWNIARSSLIYILPWPPFTCTPPPLTLRRDHLMEKYTSGSLNPAPRHLASNSQTFKWNRINLVVYFFATMIYDDEIVLQYDFYSTLKVIILKYMSSILLQFFNHAFNPRHIVDHTALTRNILLESIVPLYIGIGKCSVWLSV